MEVCCICQEEERKEYVECAFGHWLHRVCYRELLKKNGKNECVLRCGTAYMDKLEGYRRAMEVAHAYRLHEIKEKLLEVHPWLLHELFFQDIAQNNLKEVQKWIDSGVDVNAKGMDELLPIEKAMTNVMVSGNAKMVNLLIMNGAAIPEEYILRTRLWSFFGLECLEEFLKRGANPNQVDPGDWQKDCLLVKAARGNDVRTISLLLRYGANINATNNRSNTALLVAVFNNCEDAVLELLRHRADISVVSSFGNNALQLAERKEFVAIVGLLRGYEEHSERTRQLLADYVANGLPKLRSKDPTVCASMLQKALLDKNRELVKSLLAGPLDMEYCDKLGRTPLHTAGIMKNVIVFNKLARLGADIHRPDREGCSAIRYLRELI